MTTTLSPIIVQRLRMQGFTVDELCLADASLGLRVAPALCAAVAAIGTATASPTILIALAGIALLGAMMPFHPFDLIYNYGIRFWLGKRRLPPNGVPRRLGGPRFTRLRDHSHSDKSNRREGCTSYERASRPNRFPKNSSGSAG